MNWALLLVLGWTLAMAIGLCAVVLLARHRVRRLHRVDPAVPTDAPLWWVADPRAPARLHRRLARVGTATTTVAEDLQPVRKRLRRGDEPSPVHQAALDLRAQAVVVDHQLTRLSLLAPRVRRAPLAEAARTVAEIETATARLAALAGAVQAPDALRGDESAVADLVRRVDLLGEVHAELARLDRDNGLAPATAPPPPPAPAPAPAPPVARPGSR